MKSCNLHFRENAWHTSRPLPTWQQYCKCYKQGTSRFFLAKCMPVTERTPGPMVVSTGKKPLPFFPPWPVMYNYDYRAAQLLNSLCLLYSCSGLNFLVAQSKGVLHAAKAWFDMKSLPLQCSKMQGIPIKAATHIVAILQMSQTRCFQLPAWNVHATHWENTRTNGCFHRKATQLFSA